MYINNQKIIIIGASKSGLAVAEYLSARLISFYFFEELKSPKALANISKMQELGGIQVELEQEDILREIDLAVISPGVPINHPIAIKLKKMGKRIIGELEFGFAVKTPPIVAITGTNGKTTTSTLIYEILKENQNDVFLMGNVGEAVTKFSDKISPDSVCVTEVSSFQLESVDRFAPHIACVLNITPDHIERHYTMENYIFLKKRVLKNLKESEFALLNQDDDTVKQFAEGCKAKVVWISAQKECDGVFVKEGKIYYKNQEICCVSSIALFGGNIIYNVLFAVAVCKLLGVENEIIKKVISSFHGVKHRMELVAEIDGVKYYNDSKATNTASTISALSVLNSPTTLILGGSEKGEEYHDLFQKIKENLFVKQVIITGASRLKMLESCVAKNIKNVTVTESFELAVKIAKISAVGGDIVLLSPACASFDSFSCFEERGETFCRLIGEGNEG